MLSVRNTSYFKRKTEETADYVYIVLNYEMDIIATKVEISCRPDVLNFIHWASSFPNWATQMFSWPG